MAILEERIDIRVASNGRMILPLKVRKALGVSGSGVVVLSLDGEDVKISSIRNSIDLAQKLYRTHVRHDLDSEEFLETRRREAERDAVIVDKI